MASTATQSELRKLRAENEKLKRSNAELQARLQRPAPSWGGVARRTSVIALSVLAILLVVAGNLVFWAGNTVTKTDRFTAAASPVIEQPAVQEAVSAYATNQLFRVVDVDQYVQEVLPPRAEFLAPTLSQQVRTQTQDTLKSVLANERFQEEWNNALARQHSRLITLAENYEGDGTISLNDVYNRLSQQLKSTQLSFLADKQLPSSVGSFTVVDAPWLPKFHRLVTQIDLWRTLSVMLLAVCLGVAVWLSRNRRQTIYLFSFGVVVAMFATLIGLRFGQESVAATVDAQYAEGARAAFDVLTQGLVAQTYLLAAAAAVISSIAWISGQSKGAVMLKEKLVMSASGSVHRQLFGSNAHPALQWVHRNKRVLQWAMVAVATLIVLMVRLTPGVLAGYVLSLAVLIVAIEILAAPDSERRVKPKRKR